MTPQERLLNRAKTELGYTEKRSNSQLDDPTANAGTANFTKYARDLDVIGNVYNGKKNGYDWCDVFVDWCFITEFGLEAAMKMLNQAYNGLGAGVRYSAQYFKNAGRFTQDPQPADQIFFVNGDSWTHTGIVTEVSGGYVSTIEGNSGPNVNQVVQKRYPIGASYIGGYGRPDWSIAPDDEGDDDMTQEKFNEMMAVYLADLATKEPSDWSQEERAWAEGIGLIKGDGTGNKQYMSFCTREQMVVFMKRLAEMV